MKQRRGRAGGIKFGAARLELDKSGWFPPLLLPPMKKLWPNLEREDGLDTVLEVPMPEETFLTGDGSHSGKTFCTNVKAWMRPHVDRAPLSPIGRGAELQLMLGVIGAPLVPLPVHAHNSTLIKDMKEDPIEVSMARYIVQQYIAASGGDQALKAINSMYAMGKVRMTATEMSKGNGGGSGDGAAASNGRKARKGLGNVGEIGGFVLWQKKPDLWCLELMVAGSKISAGSDGKVAWRQTPWNQSHASRGPPRPLRRSLQGLDPRSTANLFANSVCLGEKAVDGEECFVLRLDTEATTLRARSSNSVEIIRHTVWGYFSQRTGLLVQLEDSHLLRIKSASAKDCVYWETTMESHIEDYRTIDGVNIAHAGRTNVSLFRFGETNDGHTRTRMEETWTVEEVDFNIWGLSMECFLPPGDLKEERDGVDISNGAPAEKVTRLPVRISPMSTGRIGPSQVASVDIDESDSAGTQEEEGST
ncbi:uncharacterized protein LOC122047151 [Zingiber officinale]|uniref:Uncharacterized protein n=1 Tax=Zingiber officinale TaxID=94328 RepID=A0A8J5I9E4_ZINOF|nr:uncharacterized protein LOC122047151 [Zingiber officinale]KAG6530971.1 hypothetical protein ZIOFF_004741 [Zingiber officinale]